MSRKTLNHIVILLLTISVFFSEKVVAQVFALDSMLNTIERNNPELRKFDAQVKAYRTYADGAKALEAPQVGAGFFMTPYSVQMWKPDGMTGSSGMGSFMVTAQQMVTNPKKLNANSTYMQSMSNVDKEMKYSMRNEMFSMAKMNYYEWQILKKKLTIIHESEEVLTYIIKSTELRYTYGMDKLNAYYKAKAMLGDMQQMRLMVSNEINQKRTALNTLMVNWDNPDYDIDSNYKIQNYEAALNDTSAVIRNRSDYKAVGQNINLMKSKQTYEYSKRLPDFGVKYDHMLTFGTQPQQFSLMGMMTIPIAPWSSKMYKSNVAGINYEIDALRTQQQALINNTYGIVESIRSQIKNKKEQIALYGQTIMPSLRRNYQTALLAYENNTEELFMVLDAWQNFKVVKIGYLDLVNDLLQLQVQYEKQLEIR